MSDAAQVAHAATPRVVEIGSEHPWAWLIAGWRDIQRAPGVSLVYGAGLAVASWILTVGLWAANMLYLLLPLAAGFMFLGPLVAVGLYDVSRRLEHGERPTLASAIATCWRGNASQIFGLGLVLMLFQLAWVRIALLIFALFFGRVPVRLDDIVATLLLEPGSIPFLVVGTAVGAALAAIAFGISVVSVPMLLDRDASVADAMAVSLRVATANWKVLIGWAALIVLFTGAGIVTFFLGLIVALPLVAHASWHAYRDMVTFDPVKTR